MSRLHSAARLSRTALAARLLAHGFYAGQDQIMLALNQEDGQTPGQLAARLGRSAADHHQDHQPAAGAGLSRKEGVRDRCAAGAHLR